MIQHQNAFEIDQKNYVAHVNLKVIEEDENILSPYFSNWYSKIVRVAEIFFPLHYFLFLFCVYLLSGYQTWYLVRALYFTGKAGLAKTERFLLLLNSDL